MAWASRWLLSCLALAIPALGLAQPPPSTAPPPPGSPAPPSAPLPPVPPPADTPPPLEPPPGTPPVDTRRPPVVAPPTADAGDPAAALDARLGSYEATALRRALAARDLTLARRSTGLPIGRIHVVNQTVFGPDEAWLQWANIFHVTTKEDVIEREVLPRPGEPWDDERVEETRRRLTDGLFTSLVVIAPVESATPGKVDLLVVTRDMWSLRLNSRFEVQEGILSDLNIALAENNLLGRRKQIAVAFDMDLGTFTIGPQYVDKNIRGTHMTLIGKWGAVFSRETGEFEGTRSATSLTYPLWSLDRKWGASLVATHYDGKVRFFCGAKLFAYQNLRAQRCDQPLPVGEEPIQAIYALRTISLESAVVRQFGGRDLKRRLAFGHRFDLVRPELLDDFPGDAATAAAFAHDLFPRAERSSALFVRGTLFTPRYRVFRDLDSYDLAEDLRLGPELEVEASAGHGALGSEVDFVAGAIGGGWTLELGPDGFVRGSAGSSVRRVGGEFTDRVVSGTLNVASPTLVGLRLMVRGTVAGRLHDTNNQFYLVGGNTGLRGYPIGFFRGDRQAIGNVELRTGPRRFFFTRVGALAFWDVGHAADRFESLRLHQDVGLGIRALAPQLQPFVFRFDWAIPLTGGVAGFPGRFSAGVQQVF